MEWHTNLRVGQWLEDKHFHTKRLLLITRVISKYRYDCVECKGDSQIHRYGMVVDTGWEIAEM